MKKIKKAIAALLVTTTLLTTSACSSSDNKWSFKDEKEQLKIGVYIYNLVEAYSSANSLVEDSSKSVFEQQIDGISASDWMLKEAENNCKKMLLIDDLMRKNNLTLTDEEKASIESSANYYWAYLKSSYEDLGVSKESYVEAAFTYTTKYNKVFYNKYDESVVSQAEIEKFFKENYVDYSYFSIPLTTTDSDGQTKDLSDAEIEKIKLLMEKYVKMINEEGKTLDDVSKQYSDDHTPESELPKEDDDVSSNTTSNDTSSKDDTSSNTTSNDTSSKDDTSSNTTSNDTSSKDDTSSNTTSDDTSSKDDTSSNTTSNDTSSKDDTSSNNEGDSDEEEEYPYAPQITNDVTILEKSSLGDELKGAIEGLEDGKATYIKVGTSYYFIYRGVVEDSIDLVQDESGRHTVLNAMKGDEFSEYIDELVSNYKVEVNQKAIDKYGIDHISKVLGLE